MGKAKLISQQTDKSSQQPENWENSNGPDLVQAFPKKWWVEVYSIQHYVIKFVSDIVKV